jgi:SpoVK/Ycf46/Vps4 family AAA+-type ATPase
MKPSEWEKQKWKLYNHHTKMNIGRQFIEEKAVPDSWLAKKCVEYYLERTTADDNKKGETNMYGWMTEGETSVVRKQFDSITDLPKAGVYKVKYGRDEAIFEQYNLVTDDLFNLPDSAYTVAVNEIEQFLNPETREAYLKYGFDTYRRSILLYGEPGTGKTSACTMAAKMFVEAGGLAFINPDLGDIKNIVKEMKHFPSDQRPPVLITLEEFEQSLEYDGEVDWLKVLDGQESLENVMFIVTTNHIDKLSGRLLRPGRFATILEVPSLTLAARTEYLNIKLSEVSIGERAEIAEKTEGFTVDDLKEVILSVKVFGKSLDQTVEQINKLKNKKEDSTDLSIAG